MAYEPPRLGLSPAQSWRQGLLDRARGGRNLLGPNLPPDGIPMGGRVSLIGPNPNALNATKGWTDSIAPRSTAVAPKVYSAGNRAVSDILRDVRMGEGSAPRAVGDILNDYGTPGSSNDLGAITDTQGEYRTSPEVAYGGFAQNPTAFPIPEGFGEGGGPPAESGPSVPEGGPEDVLAPAQGFFGRLLGDRGSGKRSDIARAMMAAGGRMMEGNPWGTLATVGQGVEAGLGAYEELEGRRLLGGEREEAKRIQDEDRARRIAAEDLATSQDAARREAYGKIMPVDPETGERGEFSMEAWDDAWAIALEQGDTDFAMVLTQMRPEDPEEIPLDDFKQMTRSQRQPDGTYKDVFYRTGADGNVEFQLSEYAVPPPASARAGGAGGAGGQFQKEESLGLVSLAAINSLVDTGGWMSLAGWVRDDDVFDELQGQILLDNPDATATQIMEATRSSWSKAEGYMPEGSWFNDDGELQLGDEAAMMMNMVLSDPSGSSEEGDWAPTKFLKAKLKEWSQSNSAGAAYATATAHALQAINPLVRYLSGAQMTNREAMRYYGAVIPSWGDSQQTVNAKMRGLSLLARAMGGEMEAMERVDMRGFVDDPNLTRQKNLEARGEWAKTQLTRVVMEEESSDLRGANVEAAQARADADAVVAASIAAQNEPFSMFRPGYTPTEEERRRAGMAPTPLVGSVPR